MRIGGWVFGSIFPHENFGIEPYPGLSLFSRGVVLSLIFVLECPPDGIMESKID